MTSYNLSSFQTTNNQAAIEGISHFIPKLWLNEAKIMKQHRSRVHVSTMLPGLVTWLRSSASYTYACVCASCSHGIAGPRDSFIEYPGVVTKLLPSGEVTVPFGTLPLTCTGEWVGLLPEEKETQRKVAKLYRYHTLYSSFTSQNTIY